MPIKHKLKEKIIAVLTVFILFTLIGSLFSYISLINKKNTEILKEKVRIAKIEALEKSRISNMTIDNLDPFLITAKSFLTFAFSSRNFQKIVAAKNPDETLPIASVTKLMTAIIALENINLDSEITAIPDFVGGDGTMKVLEVGKTYKASDLLYNMLIASDNDAAQLLASIIGTEKFVNLMNEKARQLDLIRTSYVNVTGLDPIEKDKIGKFNISSASDLVKLIVYIKKNQSNIFNITRYPQYDFCDINKNCKNIINTNQLLNDKDFKYPIIGAKTGQTLLANKN